MTRLALLSIVLACCAKAAPSKPRASGEVIVDASAAARLRLRVEAPAPAVPPDEAALRRGVHAGVGR